MSFIESDLGLTLGIALAALAFYEILLILPLRLRARRQRRRMLLYERTLDSMQEFAARLAEDRKRANARITRLEERIAQLNLRTDARPYEQAIALAENGAEQRSLSRTLGLTQGEAELVSLLHGGRARQGGRDRA